MENLKIEKGKTYTYEELKEIYKNATAITMTDPMNERKEKDPELKAKMNDADIKFIMLLNGMILFHTLEDNLFQKEENKDE